MYKVIKRFRDGDYTVYKVGDEYKNTDKAVIELLSTTKNRYKTPFIEKVKVTRKKKEVDKDEQRD